MPLDPQKTLARTAILARGAQNGSEVAATALKGRQVPNGARLRRADWAGFAKGTATIR